MLFLPKWFLILVVVIVGIIILMVVIRDQKARKELANKIKDDYQKPDEHNRDIEIDQKN